MAASRRTVRARTAGRSVTAAPARAEIDAIGRRDAAARSEFELKDETVERALRTGEHQGLLEDYFGPASYGALRELSREVTARGVRGGPRVLILPGIMGSKIGRPGAFPGGLFDDVYWFDPIDVAAGRLSELALDGTPSRFAAVGVMLVAYLKLKLRLRIAGYDAEFFPYDWRQTIADLGKELAARLADEGGEVDLVAHSMGGLVARAALAQGGACRRLVMLGTPNHGSFAPVMALRATYPVVRKVAALDQVNDAEDLAANVFSTFAGLTEMLPTPAAYGGHDLYDLDQWPADRAGRGHLRPRPKLLAAAKEVQRALAPGAPDFFLVAGVDHDTVTGLRLAPGGEEFEYELSPEGDGTVPLAFAQLSGIGATYYVAESHGSLPNNKAVARAVIDILRRGRTDVLTDRHGARAGGPAAVVPERALRVDPYDGRRGPLLSQREKRHVLDEVASPDAHDGIAPAPPIVAAAPGVAAAPAEAGYVHPFRRVVVGRERQHRIDVRFAFGSITEADAPALALGVFRGVTPGGAASAIDRRIDGAITDLARRRMFAGGVGEVFMLPTTPYLIHANLAVFVGLGDFDRFTKEVLEAAAENVIRTLLNARVDEFATVVFGGSTGGEDPAAGLRHMLVGFLRGLVDADRDHRFRRIVVCENDRDRYLALKEEMYRLSSTTLCEDVQLTFDEQVLPPEPDRAPGRRAAPQRPAPVYLIARQERTAEGGRIEIRSSLLTAGGKATVVTGRSVIDGAALEALRKRITGADGPSFDALGGELGRLLLADEVRAVLPRFRDHHLVVVHDRELSRVPWEVLAFADGAAAPWFPARGAGLSHRYAADDLSVTKFLEQRVRDEVLDVLLVVDPTLDLPGAKEEGERVRELLEGAKGVELAETWQQAATRPALLEAFSSGRYDVIHYAGHAFFDERNPTQSGILCHGRTVLSGADLAGLSNLPSLVFFNACEAGRIRGGAPRARGPRAADGAAGPAVGGRGKTRLEHVRDSVGLAEAFMRGGVASFLGTYWPVGDAAAKGFASAFYAAVVEGAALGDAILAGRAEIARERDWANYVFYGDADFVVKEREDARGAAPATEVSMSSGG